MKVVAVDIQGFMLLSVGGGYEFYPKEITIRDACQVSHYLMKPPMRFHELTNANKKQVRYTERNIHGISYSSGNIEYSECALNSILLGNYLLSAHIIYVRGHQKLDYLKKILSQLVPSSHQHLPKVVNVEKFDNWWNNPPPLAQVDITTG
uniref:Uncharacterized protein n=1 Tax=Anoplophora glabripennis TaxID=217634 RepID=V5GU84_ANOGL